MVKTFFLPLLTRALSFFTWLSLSLLVSVLLGFLLMLFLFGNVVLAAAGGS
jgi:hypothetical protein